MLSRDLSKGQRDQLGIFIVFSCPLSFPLSARFQDLQICVLLQRFSGGPLTPRPLFRFYNVYGQSCICGQFEAAGSDPHMQSDRERNMVYLESPVGVGFSYSNTSSDYQYYNDAMIAKDNLSFLLNWFDKFPEYGGVDFYIIGESYGGHYVPQLATLVMEHNKKPNIKPINLRGIVGLYAHHLGMEHSWSMVLLNPGDTMVKFCGEISTLGIQMLWLGGMTGDFQL